MGAWYNKGIPQNTFLVTTHRYSLFSPFSGLQKPPLHFVLCHDNPENVVQITPQKRPAGTNIKSNFYFVLIGYFREISDIKGDKSAGEHPIPVESGFDGKKWETEPVSGLFLSREEKKRGDQGQGDTLGTFFSLTHLCGVVLYFEMIHGSGFYQYCFRERLVISPYQELTAEKRNGWNFAVL